MASRLAFANAPTDARFVFVLLRGALDGLSAVPPVGDPDYAACAGRSRWRSRARARRCRSKVPSRLHPALEFPAPELCRERARGAARRRLALSRAFAFRCAERARERRPAPAWLDERLDESRADRAAGRQIARGGRGAGRQRAAGDARPGRSGVLVADEDRGARRAHAGAHHGSVCAGSAAVAAPRRCAGERRHRQRGAGGGRRRMPASADDDGAKPDNVVERDAKEKRNYNARYAETARAAAGFLKRDDGPRVAMFDTTGWDTHANEGGAQGQLALRLRGLDAAHGRVEGIARARCGATPWCSWPPSSAAPPPSTARAARITARAPRHSC